ncbi:MAG: acetylornithine/N-succinyldiaminopimelate aminotransferase [Parvicellaceae bacterium]|jgi:acetylornithine/N-succinyldiaminopimelate aminotransferase
MNLFDVYPRFDVTPTRANGVYLFDENNQAYLDLYGGHGVISIGHNHPEYIGKVSQQLNQIGFYSNSVNMPIQDEYADKLTKVSGYPKYKLFLCNSGAEANENAIKLASFHTGKKKVVAYKGGFHGRTAATLNVTDNKKLSSQINLSNFDVDFIELNNKKQLIESLKGEDVSAVIMEGIQGVGGLNEPTEEYQIFLSEACSKYGALLILDEIQSGFGRTGNFFAHQASKIEPDLISMAKGMGNGFPVAGVLIHPKIKASLGLLGTTFGGNHLACAAGLSVLNVLNNEKLMLNVQSVSKSFIAEINHIPAVKNIKGRGLMLGLEFDFPIAALRLKLLNEHHIFTGASANPNLLRILPPLTIKTEELTHFISALKTSLQ